MCDSPGFELIYYYYIIAKEPKDPEDINFWLLNSAENDNRGRISRVNIFVKAFQSLTKRVSVLIQFGRLSI